MLGAYAKRIICYAKSNRFEFEYALTRFRVSIYQEDTQMLFGTQC
jgi:hypothetical protein